MAKAQKKRKKPVEKPAQLFQPKDFLDLIAPAAVKFNTDSYVLGGLYRCVLALRGYPAATEELALLSHICNRAGVTLHLYARQVTAAEEDAIYHKAVNKNRLDRSNQDNLKRSVTAEAMLSTEVRSPAALFLPNLQHLLCQSAVGVCCPSPGFMLKNALVRRADLCQTHRGRDPRVQHGQTPPKVLLHAVHDVPAERGFIRHSQEHAADF